MISIDDFQKVEIRAGKILSVDLVEGSEKLLKLSVDFSEERPRQVISGIRKYFEDPQTLVGTTCAFVTNLEPREIMGLKSEAMIMAASSEEFFTLLQMNCPPGSKVK
ncbi:MAG: hypothetical protein AAB392_00615 [Patescibacteria group bacterium]